jgi:glycosyltransferase involved in cell wall biosynthesis
MTGQESVSAEDERRVIVDASNLHVGGGVQVASALVSDIERNAQELSRSYPWLEHMRFELSSEVFENIRSSAWLSQRARVMDRNVRTTPWVRYSRHSDLRFVVFSSALLPATRGDVVAGYADVTSLYDDVTPYGAREFGRSERLRRQIRRRLSLNGARRARHLIVETETVKARLEELGLDPSRISVVSNSYHPEFDRVQDPRSIENWQRSLRFDSPDTFLFLYVARAYRHKNHDYLGEVGDLLAKARPRPFKFVVTLTEQEWAVRSEAFRRHAVNVGPQAIQSLPSLYESVDGVVFPSLLECFSATPLEAIRTARPLFASDREFVREHSGEFAHYFDPLRPESGAQLLRRFMEDPEPARRLAVEARTTVARTSSWARTQECLGIIDRLRNV